MKIRQWYFIFFLACLFLVLPYAHAADVTTGVVIVVAPDAPSSFTAVPDSPTQVTLSWTDNSNDTEDGFSVERKTGAGGTYAVIGTTATGVATYVDNTVSADTTYFYRVRAFTGSVFSSYSNEASVTTPAPSTPPPSNPPSGGGGGGGGYAPSASTNNNVTITGWAYPLSEVTVLQNGILALQTIADPTGMFSVSISDFPNGSYNFYLYATDSGGRKSTPFTFPLTITTGVTTNISNVFLAPTVGVNLQEVKQGDPIAIFGQTLPNAPIKIEVDSAVPIFADTMSTPSGTYFYDLDTSQLALGPHTTKSEAMLGSMISNYSLVQAFTVGNANVVAPAPAACPPKGDFNNDCKVNLVDFSMLAYWYGRAHPPAIYLLDGESAVDLTDFSILAYYWTG